MKRTASKSLARFNCGPASLSGDPTAFYERHVTFDQVVPESATSARDKFEAIARSVRDVLSQRWVKTEQTSQQSNAKRVYYLSMEFLLGRMLANNIANLQLEKEAHQFARHHQIDPLEIQEQEPDAGLGNGGLGRLAACFLDSMATLGIPGMGYGLRYDYGIFRQEIRDGWQTERPDPWLTRPDPWEVARPNEAVEVKLYCTFEVREGEMRVIEGRPSSLIGVPYDRPVVGYGGHTVNTLRLWAARAPHDFDFAQFSGGDFVGALAESLTAETITRVLYPDDHTMQGRALRFFQEYFLVACSLADMLRRFRAAGNDWSALPEKVAIQLNDTHPTLAVPELMRILLDEAKLGWEEAWSLTQKTFAYTNHTLLPEALEKWPVQWFRELLPRHLEIIHEINRRFLDEVRERRPGDTALVQRVSLIEEGSVQQVRMAHLAIVGSHSTNGVAALHSELLKKQVVPDLAGLFPERFNNKTNGVTPRRWLLLANPALSAAITGAIGDGWITDLRELERLKPLADDRSFCEEVRQAKLQAKLRFLRWLQMPGVDPESIFDAQIKRIHEYKRQLLNALHIVVLYNRLLANPSAEAAPRTFFFAGKAAPAYYLAKLVIKFINNLSKTLSDDPAVRGRLRVIFVPDYKVSVAEYLIPATDLSEQISTAGFEASGTSNMKFMMNGALTIGTRDGATIEMAQAAGEENFFLFGLTAEQIESSRGWHNPRWHYENEPEIRAALDSIAANRFSPHEPGIFAPILNALLNQGDYYRHLADLTAYAKAHQAAASLYADPLAWTRKAVLNIAASGHFSSDRSIEAYAREIWNALPCPIH